MSGEAAILLELSGNRHGHREHYVALLSRLLDAAPRRPGWSLLVDRRPILITAIEESLLLYAGLGLVRALLGRRTAGLLMRPLPTVAGRSTRLRTKRWLLHLLRRFARIQTLTILPFSLEPRFARIAHGWIHDPQFWDCYAEDTPPSARQPGRLADAIRQAAAGRLTCCAIGGQGVAKGFDLFAALWNTDPALRSRMLFAYGGVVDPRQAAAAEAFAAQGGFARDRFISDEELFDLYAAADLIWCCYAPDYDQASGIFGRAMQLGIPMVVRKGSLIHRMCIAEGLAHVALDTEGGGLPAAALDPAAIPPREPLERAARRGLLQAGESLARLHAALGLAPSAPAAAILRAASLTAAPQRATTGP